MSDSDSDISSSDSSRGGSPEPQSLSAQEAEIVPTDEKLDVNLSATKELNTDAETLHIAWDGSCPEDSENRSPSASSPAVDFVIVHGVYGIWSDEARTGPGSGSSEWVAKYAKELNSGSRILRFEYDSLRLFSGYRSRDAIHKCALKLLQELTAKRQKETTKRLVTFVAHDIGGIIVKNALTLAALDTLSWKDISDMSRVLVFSGCPHRSFDQLDMEERLIRFLFTDHGSGVANVHPSMASIPGFASAISEFNALFIESKVTLRSRIISIHADSCQTHSINQAFDSYCGTFGIPLEERISDSNTGDNYSNVIDYLDTIKANLQALDDEHIKFERQFLSLASPIYPIRNEHENSFLTESSQYKSWLNFRGPQMLYIHNSHHIRDAAEQVFYDLNNQVVQRGRHTSVLYFSFDRWDVRYDSVLDMLSTFLAQLLCLDPREAILAKAHFTHLPRERGWTEFDVISLFRRHWYILNGENVICVVNYFDECSEKSRKLFLDMFSYFSQACEYPWKLVVTSHKPGALSDELRGCSCVNLDTEQLNQATTNARNVENCIKHVLKFRPELHLQDSLVHKELQSLSKLEPLCQHLICEQVRVRHEWPDKTSIAELFGPLELLSDSEQGDHNLKRLLDSMFRKIREQTSLRRALSWLLYSMRSLTIWELATVICLGSEHDQGSYAPPSPPVLDSIISNIQTWFAGIIDIAHNEIKFRDPRLRELLIGKDTIRTDSEEQKFIWDEIKQTAHLDIASLCLQYLSRESVQEFISHTMQLGIPKTSEVFIFPDRQNLCSYALQEWPNHFSISFPSPELSRLLPKEGSLHLGQLWARGYWGLLNPITRSATCLTTLFPIFAGLGMLDVVNPQNEADECRGLMEAAANGQSRTLERIMLESEQSFSESTLLDALVAALSFGDEEMLLYLADYIAGNSKSPGSIIWPPVLMTRAAWLGLDRFADKLLDLGCPADPKVERIPGLQESPLHLAASNLHAKTVRVLLSHGANVNSRHRKGMTPLHFATGGGSTEVLEILVKEGKADIEAVNDDGRTPLFLASAYGYHKLVEKLLQMGADPDMGILSDVGPGKGSPLLIASAHGYERTVQLLLDNGANLNISSLAEMGPPLRVTAVGGHVNICAMLLERGADPNSSSTNPPILAQVINYCSPNDKQKVLELLLSHNADINAKDDNGMPVLVHAVRCKNHGIVKLLLDHGTDIDIVDSDKNGALHHAAMNGSLNLVELLLENNAAVNCVNADGATPLHLAIAEPEIVRLLLEKGAQPDLSRCRGTTTLMAAAWGNRTETLGHLLEHKAVVDLETSEEGEFVKGVTALSLAADSGSEGGVRILIESGADPMHGTRTELPILHLAAASEVLSILLEFQSKIDLNQVDDVGFTALHRSNVPIANIKRLINAGANMDFQDSIHGLTPLIRAAGSGDTERVQCLLSYGANIHLISPNYGTALHQACLRGHLDIIKLLVENGANVNQPCDSKAGTPLISASRRFSSLSLAEEIVTYLLGHGADISVKSGLLGFPIISAALRGTPSLICLLLENGAKINVVNDIGCIPIHVAAFHSLENFQTILDEGGDIDIHDKMGRQALHWAAHRGQSQVVEKIISLSPNKQAIDAPDIDGWTPLCWAARGTETWLGDQGDERNQIQVIKLLLKHGANPCVVVSVGEQKWTPLKIARFSGQSTNVIELLTNGIEPSKETGNKKFKAGNIATGWSCDACYSEIRGFRYHCNTCANFDLCFKCHPHRQLLHMWPNHSFEQKGPEFEDTEEANSAHSEPGTESDSGSDSE